MITSHSWRVRDVRHDLAEVHSPVQGDPAVMCVDVPVLGPRGTTRTRRTRKAGSLDDVVVEVAQLCQSLLRLLVDVFAAHGEFLTFL